jgi:hypothetical protein
MSPIQDTSTVPPSIPRLQYVPTIGPGREKVCLICHERTQANQPTATHNYCGAMICAPCFTEHILTSCYDNITTHPRTADCPACKRPITRPHPYAYDTVTFVATSLDRVRLFVGDMVFHALPIAWRQRSELLTEKQAMLIMDPEGTRPRAQQTYEEMVAAGAAGWRLYVFEETKPGTFMVAEGWKGATEDSDAMQLIHPALRPQVAALESAATSTCRASTPASEAGPSPESKKTQRKRLKVLCRTIGGKALTAMSLSG